MSTADDGTDQGWIGRLSRLLGTRADEHAAAPALRPASDLGRVPPELALLDAAVLGMPDPVVVLDQDGRVLAFNTEAIAMAPALRRGEPGSIALRMPELVDAIRRAILTGKAQRIEFSSRLPSTHFSEAFISPVALPAGGTRAGVVVITVHDLTPIRRVEEMRADFVANVSHELRTPLAALTGFIETLQGPARDDPAARERFLGIMQAQAWRMARLIDDLLSLSRIELRAHQQPETPVDLVPIVRQVADGLQTLARDRDVAVEITAPAGPLMVPGDRDELTRLFENLIENGLKYGASGKRVDIAVTPLAAGDGKGEVRVTVRDYGPGIAAEHLPRLTERFYRADVGESRAQGGTGLGLALVKHILNRHHGRLSIDSREGEGATFTVRLPMSGDRAAAR
ncbi:MAG: two-component system, OmpR family, phosphate regulon sensor histidine kinase PhoR [Alphaproteobacteria bacterium]|jgi:two-component system phosphate regulon sensor histidine kinase PhoR|nr:two-component system, OmpR family, phosphate regulon sensor histidine kinase PhoR [Alphaproteobacteria bacterium]